MPRIPYTPEDISVPTALVETLRARQGGELLDVQRMMLHSPALATAWSGFFSGIKSGMQLSARLRELIACAVGSVNGASYQVRQHGAAFLAAGGSADQLEALCDVDTACDSSLFDATDHAVLRLAREMTRQIRVSDEVFNDARALLGSDQAMVEAVGVVAGYNLVSRFLVALDV